MIAAFNAVSRVDDFACIPEQSISSGMMTCVAQNRGAGQKERVLETLRTGMTMELVYGVLICGLYVGVHYALRWKLPELYARYSNDVALAALNSIVITALTIPFHEHMGFGESVLFGFETGLSFLMGLLIVLEGQRRLATARVPRAFRGLPVMLLYIGLLAMALYGFVGHQLPF